MADDASLKVLLLAAPFSARGSSVYTLRLAENFEQQNIRSRIICADAGIIDADRRAALDVHEYPFLDLPVLGRLIRSLVLRENLESPPDLIHVQSRDLFGVGQWLAMRMNCPCVLTVHEILPRNHSIICDPANTTRLIAVSRPVRTVLKDRLGLSDDDISVIHCGVESTVRELPPVLDAGHHPVIGVAGPLERVKGLHFFLGAAQQVLAVSPQVEFLISGAGPEEANLRRLANELGIADQVTFVPNLSDFAEPLAAMDIFCLPSLQQGLGTIMLEAMSLGKPVIASGVGGVFTVIQDGKTGLVVPPSNCERLAERMLELLNDPVRARSIGEAGRTVVRDEFGTDQMVKKTAAVYRQVLADAAEKKSAEKTEKTVF